MSATPAAPTASERAATGLAARRITPLEAHAEWSPPADRDPIANLERQALDRDPDLVAIRHARMAVSPFACYRGAALTMALDLAGTPSSGFDVQACGDAHLSNFGLFGSPERHLLFDVNDFDETAEAPWEWDLKRLVASIEIAARANAFKHKERRAAIVSTVREYRVTMATFAAASLLDIWYTRFSVDECCRSSRTRSTRRRRPRSPRRSNARGVTTSTRRSRSSRPWPTVSSASPPIRP